ncbi:hypothetical protein Trco_001823 [Trichoderma cornu-damae]|uniref:Chromo domain-containing protein n=1 Tax=Trichoderma cornu-damae TaxID=654480 RepID=A0A9P8QTS1_9HYPO|nr:hypothetical protein Trco_001823 [Trichoderma cornu-damae]
MKLVDTEFWHQRLSGRGMAPVSQPGSINHKAALARPSARARIAIPLVSKPADYVPGSGPPLQPISLLPPGDSTAHIIERLLLPSPGLAPNGRLLPKRMAYLIGWRDLPAASMLVPAMQVLDYVSPRTLEEFEEELEQELDDEKGRLEEEFKSDLVAPQKKRRGRPPAHSQIESAVVAEPETVAQAKSRHKKGVMSLSTPQKSRLEEFAWLSDEEGSPSRQIAEEELQSLRGYLADEDEVTEDNADGPLRGEPPYSLKQPPPPSSSTAATTPPENSSGAQTPTKYGLPSLSKHGPGEPGPGPSSFTSSFVAAGRSERQSPPGVAEAEGNTSQSIPAIAKPETSKKRPRPEDDNASAGPQNDGDWVVERIEDVEYYEVDGRGLVRYFRVSWEGDWPPDQKRTWEPEENIPPSLVRNFFKTPKSKRRTMSKLGTIQRSTEQSILKRGRGSRQGVHKHNAHKRASSPKQTRLQWPAVRRKYSSVSEAFAGDQDSPGVMDESYDGEQGELDGDEQDEFFVVTEDGDDQLRGPSLWPTTGGLSTTTLDVLRGFR